MTFSALDSALTGPLLATDAMRAVFSDEARLSAMLHVEAALARAQAAHGLVPDALAAAIDALPAGALDAAAIGQGTKTAIVTTVPFVKAVQALLPDGMEAHFHYGSTAQDIMDTALVLQMREAFRLLAGELAATMEALIGMARAHRKTPCAGRTYGQHAAAITFGFKAAIWSAGLAECAMSLDAVRDRALTASCGGPAGTLTTLGTLGPAVADQFARELDLAPAAIAWHVRRSRVVETASWLVTLMGAMAKMATDISYLVSTDIAEAAEPHHPGRGGSSAMPHKRNPVSTTVILAAFSAAKGHLVTLMDGMPSAHERPAGNWQAEWNSLPQLFGLASGALRESRVLAEGLEVNAGRMLANLEATRGLLFTDVAASRLAAVVGRKHAHALVLEAADQVRLGSDHLRSLLRANPALQSAEAQAAIDAAFDLTGAVSAAAVWTDRAIAFSRDVLAAGVQNEARARETRPS